MIRKFIREEKHEEYVKKIEAEFISTLEKRFNEIEAKFKGENKDKKINKPKILGGETEQQTEANNHALDNKISPSPTVEEINNQPPQYTDALEDPKEATD